MNAERGMTGNWVQVPQQQRQLTGTGLAAVDITDALRHGFDQRWCAAYIDGKCSGDACPNGRPTPFVHPKNITPQMKAFASAYFEWKDRSLSQERYQALTLGARATPRVHHTQAIWGMAHQIARAFLHNRSLPVWVVRVCLLRWLPPKPATSRPTPFTLCSTVFFAFYVL